MKHIKFAIVFFLLLGKAVVGFAQYYHTTGLVQDLNTTSVVKENSHKVVFASTSTVSVGIRNVGLGKQMATAQIDEFGRAVDAYGSFSYSSGPRRVTQPDADDEDFLENPIGDSVLPMMLLLLGYFGLKMRKRLA